MSYKFRGCRYAMLVTDDGYEVPVMLDHINYGLNESTEIRCTEMYEPSSHRIVDMLRDVYARKLCIPRPRITLEPLVPKNPNIKKVIHNDPATIVIWDDGTKTVVKCQEGDKYNAELGLAMCISKKYFGNKGNFNEVFKKWIPEEKKIGISVEEMRHQLSKYCDDQGIAMCSNCPLKKPVCRCGCGTHFLTKKGNSDHYDMSDDEIRDAYKIVFGK